MGISNIDTNTQLSPMRRSFEGCVVEKKRRKSRGLRWRKKTYQQFCAWKNIAWTFSKGMFLRNLWWWSVHYWLFGTYTTMLTLYLKFKKKTVLRGPRKWWWRITWKCNTFYHGNEIASGYTEHIFLHKMWYIYIDRYWIQKIYSLLNVNMEIDKLFLK